MTSQKETNQLKEKETEAVVQESRKGETDTDIEENSEDEKGQLLPDEDMTIKSTV